MGVANRGDYDLRCLTQGTKKEQYAERHKLHSLSPVEDELERFTPYVIEPSVGLDRLMYAILTDSITKDSSRKYNYLKLPSSLSPYMVAILPMAHDEETIDLCETLWSKLVARDFRVHYDPSDANRKVGKSFRVQDQIGTAFCITVDSESVAEQAVTVRERDSKEQVRVRVSQVLSRAPSDFDELVPLPVAAEVSGKVEE
eukprot:TRINITY_DN7889_c0_g1_i1.p1 TRINITY_DN7889_c0_g1~~TRINITY_DN7889_c0_g1_i1.p1  ORF type:complete len:200 (-),score=31.24 TRINITY_DN7889_c0_g1_i1:82-681(-)